MINIVLFEPEIPPNTGNIIRLAANTGASLHLVEPFGFDLADKKMRRAGLDYHEYAGVSVYPDWEAFRQEAGTSRCFGISTRGGVPYDEVSYTSSDYLVFGPETRGLPDRIREEIGAGHMLRIPMVEDSRSLNLANAVAVVVFEAWRQMEFTGGA